MYSSDVLCTFRVVITKRISPDFTRRGNKFHWNCCAFSISFLMFLLWKCFIQCPTGLCFCIDKYFKRQYLFGVLYICFNFEILSYPS